MMENTYFLTSTRGRVGLPTALLKLLGLRAGEPVRLTTRARQIIITPLNEPTSGELMADTAESFTVDELAASFSNSELSRLSQTVLQETPADYDVGEFNEAVREAEPIELLPFSQVRLSGRDKE
jgi:bifunctional DNA-binding transcriptional regulator/antitoxin component of YhaV-PrlF toxin-antitoxin module